MAPTDLTVKRQIKRDLMGFVEQSQLCGAAKTDFSLFFIGAGEGNRTLVVSLGSFCSTIELHTRSLHFTRDGAYWQTAYQPIRSFTSS